MGIACWSEYGICMENTINMIVEAVAGIMITIEWKQKIEQEQQKKTKKKHVEWKTRKIYMEKS